MMAWGLITQRVQSEKVAVFFPPNISPPKKKSISCEEKKRENSLLNIQKMRTIHKLCW